MTSSMIEFAMFNGAKRYFNKRKKKWEWAYDRAVEPVEAPWTEIVNALFSVTVIAEKELAPMVSFQTFVPFDEVKDEENRICRKDWREGPVYTKAIADNVLTLTALTVDMENERWPIDKFIRTYEDLEFFLGTSFKHESEPDEQYRHRYRAVFPLAEPMPIVHLRDPGLIRGTEWSVLPDLKTWFPGCDKSTFDRSRCVFVPSCPPERVNQFRAHHNQGTWFDWKDWLGRNNGKLGVPKPPPKPGSIKDIRRREMEKRTRHLTWTGVDDCPFVKRDKLAWYMSTPHGEHHLALYKMMCSIAMSANARGRPLEQFELENLAMEVHMMLPCEQCDKGRRNYAKEAAKVLTWANSR